MYLLKEIGGLALAMDVGGLVHEVPIPLPQGCS